MCTSIAFSQYALYGRNLDLECGFGEQVAIAPRKIFRAALRASIAGKILQRAAQGLFAGAALVSNGCIEKTARSGFSVHQLVKKTFLTSCVRNRSSDRYKR